PIAAAIVGGAFPGFFLVFAGVFADAPPGLLDAERLVSYALVVGAFALLAGITAWWQPREGWRWGLWWGATSVVILLLYTFDEPQNWPLHLLYLVLAVGSGVASGYAVAKLRHGRPA
ncbi:MAG TPA: hypothetical protein VI818_03730, partial [Candidatus Thermoplasmatota archaeon]|nr:hypothetical protein [Candidatus Thermoplasmatota archaeon]